MAALKIELCDAWCGGPNRHKLATSRKAGRTHHSKHRPRACAPGASKTAAAPRDTFRRHLEQTCPVDPIGAAQRFQTSTWPRRRCGECAAKGSKACGSEFCIFLELAGLGVQSLNAQRDQNLDVERKRRRQVFPDHALDSIQRPLIHISAWSFRK